MPTTTIDFNNYVSDGDSRLWPALGQGRGQRSAQPLRPLLVVLRDYIRRHHALEFLPYHDRLRVLNLPAGYLATEYINNSGRVVKTYHGHPRGGQWTSFSSFIPHLIAILRGDVARCGCVLCARHPHPGTPASKLPRAFWQIR